MIAVDASVAVAAFASWHEGHEESRQAIAKGALLPAHAALEIYSVLTRLPPPHRVEATVAQRFLAEQFAEPFLTLSAAGYKETLSRLADEGVGGGAVYDAIIGATAREAGVTLATRDRRAAPTYDLIGVSYELMQ